VYRTTLGDLKQTGPLLGAQFPLKYHLTLNNIDTGFRIGSAVIAVTGMDLESVKPCFDARQGPILPPGIHLDRHYCACPKGAQQQVIGVGAHVVTHALRFVCDELMAPCDDFNL
jgi:hypothetical protein